MKFSLRHVVLAVLSFLPLTSVAQAAAIAKGRERNNDDRNAAADESKDSDGERKDTDGNISRDD